MAFVAMIRLDAYSVKMSPVVAISIPCARVFVCVCAHKTVPKWITFPIEFIITMWKYDFWAEICVLLHAAIRHRYFIPLLCFRLSFFTILTNRLQYIYIPSHPEFGGKEWSHMKIYYVCSWRVTQHLAQTKPFRVREAKLQQSQKDRHLKARVYFSSVFSLHEMHTGNELFCSVVLFSASWNFNGGSNSTITTSKWCNSKNSFQSLVCSTLFSLCSSNLSKKEIYC